MSNFIQTLVASADRQKCFAKHKVDLIFPTFLKSPEEVFCADKAHTKVLISKSVFLPIAYSYPAPLLKFDPTSFLYRLFSVFHCLVILFIFAGRSLSLSLSSSTHVTVCSSSSLHLDTIDVGVRCCRMLMCMYA